MQWLLSRSILWCIKCQKDHRSKHKKACKKRAAELRDEILFKQPENHHFGDCPICCLPLMIEGEENFMATCCSKIICYGCQYANEMREKEGGLEHKCAFCRKPTPKSQESIESNLVKRVEVNDPAAICAMGLRRIEDGDYKSAFEYLSKAAALGNMDAHVNLSLMYYGGYGVEKDERKRVYHLEEAAIGGHVDARLNLAGFEAENRMYDRAAKHFIIAANLGCGKALEGLKLMYSVGHVAKEDFAAALRAQKAAVDAMKSPQREAAKAAKNE